MGKIYVEIQGRQVTPLPLPEGAHERPSPEEGGKGKGMGGLASPKPKNQTLPMMASKIKPALAKI